VLPSAATSKTAVAVELLDRAIELYLREDSFFAALHLAGAAEEFLNVYARTAPELQGSPLVPAFDSFKEAVVLLSAPASKKESDETEKWVYDHMTYAKNSVKHMRGGKDTKVEFNAKEEAYDTIDRAITTYFQLMSVLRLPHLPSIGLFDKRRRSESA